MNRGIRLIGMVVGIQMGLTAWINAQGWQGIGKFEMWPTCLFHDSLTDRLFLAGGFASFDSVAMQGFGYLDGDSIQALGCGFGVACNVSIPLPSTLPTVHSMVRFQGTLYATGEFDMAGGQPCIGIAKWGISDWEPIGEGLKNHDGSNGVGHLLKVINNELYLGGIFGSVNGTIAEGLAKFDGSSWSTVYDLPLMSTIPTSPNMVFAIEQFNGELFIGGNFSKPGSDPPLTDLAKWNGTDWVAVGQGISGGYNSIQELCLYRGNLIIAGGFNYSRNPGSIPGNNITIWDGQNWDTLRGGLLYQGTSGVVDDVIVIGDRIYVCGGFDQAGGLVANEVAMWDGESWCTFSHSNQFISKSMAFLGDTLYINYWSTTGTWPEFPSGIARWLGPSNGTQCQPVSAPPPTSTPSLSFSISPNPGNGLVTLRWDSKVPCSATLEVHDILGRMVYVQSLHQREGSNTAELDLGHLPAGTYFVRMLSREGQVTVKYVRL